MNVTAHLYRDPYRSFHRFQCLLPAQPNVGIGSKTAIGQKPTFAEPTESSRYRAAVAAAPSTRDGAMGIMLRHEAPLVKLFSQLLFDITHGPGWLRA